MAIVASDTFNRADSSTSLGNSDGPGSLAWSALNLTWGISSNQAYCVPATDDGVAAINPASGDDMLAQVDFTAGVGAEYPAVVVRLSDVNNFYMVHLDVSNSQLRLYKRQSGSYTFLAQAGSFSIPITVGLKVVGSNLTVYANAVSVITQTDSSLATGTSGGLRQGYAGSSHTMRWDNFSIDDLTGGGTDLAVPLLRPNPQLSIYRM
jgi:hypothetical protein